MNKRIEVIQLLRGIAAILVCFFHMKTMLNFPSIKLGEMLFGHGAIGVPLFFIISGFIMVFTTKSSDGSGKYVATFLVKRLLRIIPIYFFLTFLYMLFQGSLVDYFTTKSNVLIRALTFQPTFLKHTGSSYGMPPLIVGWSLNYEMMFYILFAVSMFLKKFRYVFIFALFLFLVFIVPILHHGFITLDSSRYYEYPIQYMNILTNPTLLFFLIGVAFGLIYLSDFQIQSGIILFTLLGISIVFFLIILFINPVIFQPTQFMLLSCGLLVFVMLMIQKRYDFRVPKKLVYLGDMSYSVYLVHPLIINFVSDFFKKIGIPFLTKQPLFFFEATILIIFFSILSYEYIEKRFVSYLTSKIIKKKKVAD